MSYFMFDIFTSIQMIESATSYANSTPGLKSITVIVDSNDCFWSTATSTTIIKRIVHINLFLVIVGGFFFRCPHDIWEVKTETQLWAWNMAQRLSAKCERPIFLKVQVASNKDYNKAPKYLL